MGMSLSEIGKSGVGARPERTYRLCLATSLLAEVQALTEELMSLPRGDAESGPKKMSDGRAGEIRQALTSLHEQMESYTGELRLRALPDDEWQEFKDEHPAREDHPEDEEVAGGWCDSDALRADLARWMAAWDGEEMSDEDRAVVMERAAGADKKQLVTLAVGMQEVAVQVPFSPTAWSGTPTSEDDSTSLDA